MKTVHEIIEEVIRVEGGYSNHPSDRGGETNWGITAAVARANGYTGPMRDLPRATAYGIYIKQYVQEPGFDRLLPLSEAVVAELVDTGINMGPHIAGTFLQRALNVLNNRGTKYSDLVVDGKVGPATVASLRSFLLWRGKEAEAILVRALNCLQGARYIELAEGRPANEDFVFGWLKNRVS